MIQDIAPHNFSNDYDPKPPQKTSILLCYQKGNVLVKHLGPGNIQFPTFQDAEQGRPSIYDGYTYLFTIDEQQFYLGENIGEGEIPGFWMEQLECLKECRPKHLAFAGITGAQLSRWYRNRKFCGACGNKMKQDSTERMLYCETCGQEEYPKIMPAVIVGIIDGNKLLLSQYAKSNGNRYALIAGFTEIGETIEDTVRREVMEEVGLSVKNIQFYKSQPWSFSDTLLMGFYAELDGSREIVLDQEELASAEWFERKKIPVKATHLSLTNEMIMRFKEGEN